MPPTVVAEVVVNATPTMAETIFRVEPVPIMVYATVTNPATTMIPKDVELVQRCYNFIKNTYFWGLGEQYKPNLNYTPLESVLVVLHARMRLKMGFEDVRNDKYLAPGLPFLFPGTRPESVVQISPHQWRSFEAVVNDFCKRMMMMTT